jgi:RNA polymerase sigma-70 factor (ECF subfamily)
LAREVVQAARQGDQGAFMQLVRLHGDHLYAVAYRMLRDQERARDALQDALILAWRDLPALRDVDRFEPWIKRIVINVCIAQAVNERRLTASVHRLPGDQPLGDQLGTIADRDQLDRGFQRLEPKQRALLVLHHYLGYTPTEISQVLGVPAGTVRSRLHHAHRAMRAALDAEARIPATRSEMA